jgi:protein-tyrosine phosphatase
VPLIDIHCHILPAIDDGAADRAEALAMARIAAADGIATIVATPHQLGEFAYHGDSIRAQADAFQRVLDQERVPLSILPGAELRIGWRLAELELIARLRSGELLTLADRGRHVLLDLPEKEYVPFDQLLAGLTSAGVTAILAHPERNREILAQPGLLHPLVEAGCLLQVTAGSLLGEFGADVQQLADWLIRQAAVQLVASDAHHLHFRRPALAAAFDHVAQIVGVEAARVLCHHNPASIIVGRPVVSMDRPARSP